MFDDLKSEVIEDEPLTEEEAAAAWERRQGSYEFYRVEMRHTKNRRELDCGHTIPPRLEYRYSVAKLQGIPGLLQVTQCDVCMRLGDHY